MARIIQTQIQDSIEGKRQKIALVIDEASLLRLEVFMELHTLTQFQGESKPPCPSSSPDRVTSWINSSTELLCPYLPG
jgi:hypothetical protein